ncbi:hypothetical protein BDN72DRAFT_896928 [Pluteus cervinus]|uniref:Uncharacterized protein n=1 Tax=Pluteus cervinus TaxID=181527 RepID=A0ACD3AVU0_9AGAR|nr:hypothetical protein BDN72DRAFT_896928 [Pluteus cervinus]
MRALSDPSLQTHALYGDKPPFNVWTTWAVDDTTQQAYVYGGCRPGDDSNNPTNDFYALKIKDNLFTWRRLNDSLRYRGRDRFSPGKVIRHRPFPSLRQPGMTLATINDNTFIFLFGGFSSEFERVVSDLIAVDVSSEEWWFINLEGGPVIGRLDAAIAVVGHCLYIFGGRQDFGRNHAISSYCVARYSVNRRTWTWVHQDRPYPKHVPYLGFGMVMVPIQHRRRIVLLPGRKRRDEDPINLTQKTVFLFDVDDLSFTLLNIPAEDFPCLEIQGLDAAPLHPSTLPRVRTAPFRFLLAGWVPCEDGSLIPELWMCKPYGPSQNLRCLGVMDKIWEKDLDLQNYIMCDGRILFVGYEHRGLDYVHPPEDSTWNVVVEVILN